MNLHYEPLGTADWARDFVSRDPMAAPVFLSELSGEPESFTAVTEGDAPVALATVSPGKDTFLMLFVAVDQRRRGIGSAVLAHLEEKPAAEGAQRFFGFYRRDIKASAAFAARHGYVHQFASAFLRREGAPFPMEDAPPVRGYRDEDYPESQDLYARAFHEMRLRVGDFPDSVCGRPSEAERKSWREDAANRFVFLENGLIAGHGHLCGNEIGSVSVKPELQGRGIGRRFVKYLCNEIYRRGCGGVTLECVVGNGARRLYEELGFQELYIEEFVHKHLNQETPNIREWSANERRAEPVDAARPTE